MRSNADAAAPVAGYAAATSPGERFVSTAVSEFAVGFLAGGIKATQLFTDQRGDADQRAFIALEQRVTVLVNGALVGTQRTRGVTAAERTIAGGDQGVGIERHREGCAVGARTTHALQAIAQRLTLIIAEVRALLQALVPFGGFLRVTR